MKFSVCNQTYPELTGQPFNFDNLWDYTKKINATCPWDKRLFGISGGHFDINSPLLTNDAAERFVGSGWLPYPFLDIFNRISTWKYPELQLIVMFPRPPLGFSVELMVFTHLLGDPIDTIDNLHLKLYNCQLIAEWWQVRAKHVFSEDSDQAWKALGIITDAYAEWGREVDAREMLYVQLFLRPRITLTLC